MNRLIPSILIMAAILLSASYAKDDYNALANEFNVKPQREAGLMVAMAETGSSFGAFMSWPFGDLFHAGIGIDAFFLRDSRQVEFVDPIYGGMYTLNKENNVYLFDAMFSLKRRFFAEDMHESFRPFLTGGFGPTYGVNFPEKNDKAVQQQWTVGGYVGGGVDVSVDAKYFVSVRAQYRVIPFSKLLGEKRDHSMFEVRFNVGWRFD